MYINDSPNTGSLSGLLCRFHWYVCHGSHTELCSQQASARSETCYKCWNTKIKQDKTRKVYFSHRLKLSEAHLTSNERNIPFVNLGKYTSVKRITWRSHIEMIEAKAFRTFSRVYPLFESERLKANIKLTLHKALIR
jgi:hypothetical protein